MKLHHLILVTLSLFSASCHASSVTADGRPRGIKKVDIPLYTSTTFACRSDPSIVIPASHINDDYCDCTDGSDEPGTSACEHGTFWCRNVGWRGEMLKSSRINDGICDCCDGSDEWEGRVSCPNTCIELGKASGEDQLAKIQKMEAGASQRSTLITEAQRILAERQAKLTKYEARIVEKSTLLESIKTQKEAAEAVEAEERRIAEEAAAAKAAEEDRIRQEAEAAAAAANPPVEGGEVPAPTTEGISIDTSAENPLDIEIPAVPGIAGIGMAGVGIAGTRPAGMAGVGVPAPTPTPAEPEPAVESFPYPAEYAYNPNADKKDTTVEDPVLKEAQEDAAGYDDEDEPEQPPSPPVQTDTRTEAQKAESHGVTISREEDDDWEDKFNSMVGVASIRGGRQQSQPTTSTQDDVKPKKKKKKGKKGKKGKKKKKSTVMTEEEHPIYGPRTKEQDTQWKLDEKTRQEQKEAEEKAETAKQAEKEKKREERRKKREERLKRMELGFEPDDDDKQEAKWQDKWNSIVNAQYDKPADALRAQYSEMESSHRKTQDKLDKVKKLLSNDYGESGEFTTLEGQCYQLVIRQYTYEVCPYDESRQIEGHSRTSLGKFSGWKERVIDPLATPDKGYVYPRIMEFTGGQGCWNGPARSAAVEFECGETTAILSVDEPSRCVYAMRMSTPAVCQPDDIAKMRLKLEQDMKLTAEMED